MQQPSACTTSCNTSRRQKPSANSPSITAARPLSARGAAVLHCRSLTFHRLSIGFSLPLHCLSLTFHCLSIGLSLPFLRPSHCALHSLHLGAARVQLILRPAADGPNHLGLRHNALPEHQMALITSAFRGRGVRYLLGPRGASGAFRPPFPSMFDPGGVTICNSTALSHPGLFQVE